MFCDLKLHGRVLVMAIDGQFLPPAFNFHRFPTACDRHPGEQVTGFCASCLRERLTGLDAANDRYSSFKSSDLKSIIRLATGGGEPQFSFSRHRRANIKNTGTSHKSSSVIPELRRCKSFAGGASTGVAVGPERKSCDARVRRTLWSLFYQDDGNRTDAGADQFLISSSVAPTTVRATGKIGKVKSVVSVGTPMDVVGEKVLEDLRPMKDHIDLESHAKKASSRDLKEIAVSFLLAASLISKKLKIWRKRKPSKSPNGINKASTAWRLDGEKTTKLSRRFRDTQSEIGVDVFGRRSCDIAPRFSLNARISLDDPGCSWDEPRGSWDGYLLNDNRSVRSQLPGKLAVVSPPSSAVQHSDSLISVEEDTMAPGCTAQMRDYYSDSSSRRRSLDCSSYKRRYSVEHCDIKPASISNITDLFHFSNLEQESEVWKSVSFREQSAGSFDSAFRDLILKAPPVKKSCQWNVWGFIQGRNQSRAKGPDVIERSFSETCPERRENGHSRTILQCSSSLGDGISYSNIGVTASSRNSDMEVSGQKKKKKKNKELVHGRSRSSRYSPSHFDDGLLRFYLTPLRGKWIRGISPKSKFGSPASFNSSILRLF